jgi:D-xylose transport system permease protein
VLAGVLFVVRDTRRRASGLAAPPASVTALKIAAMAVAGVVVVLIGNTNRGVGLVVVRGVPWMVLLILVVVVAWSFLLGRTRFGRYMYAIGGNAEAARRAGINLSRIRVLAFVLTGLTAGIMGII